MQGDIIDTVTFQLANLEITVTARSIPGSSGYSVGAAAGETARIEISQGLQERAISATTARALGELPLQFLDHLLPRLRATSTGSEWGPQARIGRAFRAGVIAGRHLRGISGPLWS